MMLAPASVSILRTTTLLAVLALAGCGAATRTPFQEPSVSVPKQWRTPMGLAQAQATLGSNPWWHAFNDVQLNALVETMLRSNVTLESGALNAQRAHKALWVARAGVLPTFGLSADASGSRNFRGSRATTRSQSLGVSISYGIDLWGTMASQIDAARLEAQATEQDWENLVLQQIGATISLYGTMAYLTRQLQQNEQSIEHAQRTLDFATTRYQLGAAPAADRLMAEQSLSQQTASRSALLDQKAQAENAMSLMLGEPLNLLLDVSADILDRPLVNVAPSIPANLLSRRPDLRAAEMRLRASQAQVDATRTSFYPNLTLTASGGTSSEALRNLLQNPLGSAAAGLSFPLLNQPLMKATVETAQTSHELSVTAFRQAFYQSLQEVDDALAARGHNITRAAELTRSVELALEIERRHEYAYRAGQIALPTLLDAQESRRSAQTSLAAIRYAQWSNQVTLYQALGGDFSDSREE